MLTGLLTRKKIMAEPKKPTKTAPIVDVNKPGKTPPSPTSKQIIVNHLPVISDPMVLNKDDNYETASGSVKSKTPTSDMTESDKPKVREKAEATIEPDANAPSAKDVEEKTSDEPEPKEAEPKDDAKSTSKDEPEDKTSSDKPADEASPETQNPDVAAQAEQDKLAKHEAEIQKLVDDKKYFLQINTIERRRSRQVVVIGVLLSLVLALLWVDVALDAGLIKINGVKPVTHFFSN